MKRKTKTSEKGQNVNSSGETDEIARLGCGTVKLIIIRRLITKLNTYEKEKKSALALVPKSL